MVKILLKDLINAQNKIILVAIIKGYCLIFMPLLIMNGTVEFPT